MKNLVNEAVIELINNGMISFSRLNSLIEIKEFIDRISSKRYIDDAALAELEEKFGVKPNIVTWGDYFQTELASSLIPLTDDEFATIIDTVKYDMLSSYIIFSEKDSSFFEWVDSIQVDMSGREDMALTSEEDEFLHLKILKDYYLDMGLTDKFTEAEMHWYWSFKEAVAI